MPPVTLMTVCILVLDPRYKSYKQSNSTCLSQILLTRHLKSTKHLIHLLIGPYLNILTTPSCCWYGYRAFL